jgi:hypothetical protein
MIGLPRLSIARLAGLMAAAMAVGLLGMAMVGALVIVEIDDVTARWQKFDVEAITKLDALADLRLEMGIGSVVDYLHQYLDHHDDAHRAQLEESLRLARANLDAYRLAGRVSATEEQSLADVAAVLDHITAAAPDKAGDAGGVSDADLQSAAQSLAALDRVISENSAALSQAMSTG